MTGAPQEAQRQGNQPIHKVPEMPEAQEHRPLYALMKIQEDHTGTATCAGLPARAVENGAHPTTKVPVQNQKSQLTQVSSLPDTRRDSPPLPAHLPSVQSPKGTTRKNHVAGSKVD